MSCLYGYAGTILRIDLTKKEIVKEPLKPELARDYLGGRGINSKILYEEVPRGTDPFAPENRLIIGTGPVTGTLGPTSGRFTITAKSPLTGIFGDSNSGGYFAPELKFAGYDHIVIKGKAANPVYLWIDDENIEIKDAKHLWGKDVHETDKIIRIEDIGDRDIRIMAIGPAGENLVRFACVIGDLYRAAGRCGMGAVMGSKNLKAIAVRGSKSIKIARPREYLEVVEKLYKMLSESPFVKNILGVQGTPSIARSTWNRGAMPINNWSKSDWWSEEKMNEISAETFLEKYVVKPKACFGCPIHCSHNFVVKEGQYSGTYGGGIEWNLIGACGTVCGNSNLASLCKINDLCNRYAMDVTCVGNIIAFATECYEKGLLTKEDTNGLDLRFGNYEAEIEMVRKIAFREGLGDVLANGVLSAVKKIGKGSYKFAVQTKGMGPEPIDLRAGIAYALGHITSPRGSDHLRGAPNYESGFSPEAIEAKFGAREGADPSSYHLVKARMLIETERTLTAADLLESCKFATEWWGCDAINARTLAELASTITGFNISGDEMVEICDRVYTLERAFNAREGLTRKADVFPSRFYEEPIASGPRKGTIIDREKIERLKDKYYELRGWDVETGNPTPETLGRLKLDWVNHDLEAAKRNNL